MNRKHPMTHFLRVAIIGATLLLFCSFAQAADTKESAPTPLPAKLGDFALKFEAGVAIPLTEPQTQRFKVGGEITIKAFWAMTKWLDFGPSASFVFLPRKSSAGNDSGTAWAFGPSLQFKRPHDAPNNDKFWAISPWADVDALYVRTGNLNRFGFAAATGLAVPLGKSRMFWLGPFVRYFQILQQPERKGYDNRSAKIITVGLSFEVDPNAKRHSDTVASVEPSPVVKEVAYCSDRDADKIPDSVDRCPDVFGTADNYGCPTYKKVIVKPDKLELTEKIQFAWNEAVLLEESYPLLDDVAQALKDNKAFRVQVDGHASSEGTFDHNQTLSEARAEAVVAYLASHGIAKDRLVSKGFSSSVPIDTNSTAAGRENNRRVEFVVSFIILKDGSK